jgi:hypothetical protein
MAEQNGGFLVEPARVNTHVAAVQALLADVDRLAGPVAGLYPAGGASWIGSDGGARMLQSCFSELAEALRRTSANARAYGDRAKSCAVAYSGQDTATANSFSQCLAPLGK